MSQVRLEQIDKVFGTEKVLNAVNLEAADGEFVVFVGPSGCGKTTLMRTIAGLERPSAGHVYIDDHDVTHLHPARRGVAMVFQSYALYPHMTVAENIGFGLRIAKKSKKEVEQAVQDVANILQIGPLLARKPAELSGGQRQRVAIGRSIVREPDVFLFDEPLSNLDALLRVEMRLELIKLHRRLKATMIYVTHDQTEAMTMADRIVVLNQGRVEQIGTPMDLYSRPQNLFVAGFIGAPKMNFINVRCNSSDDAGITVELNEKMLLLIPADGSDINSGNQLTLGIRPEHLGIWDENEKIGETTSPARVTVVEHLGSESVVHVALGDGTELQLKTREYENVKVDEELQIVFRTSRCHLFNEYGVVIPPLELEKRKGQATA